LTAAVLAVVYLRWTPLVPDLAAQVARADVVRRAGTSSWWTGWFGGLATPSYSVLVPSGMAIMGVRTTGALAMVIAAMGSARLAQGSLRPRAAACAFAVSGAADLLDGRVTFLVGTALAVWSLNALRDRRPILCGMLGCAAYFASPLAALFLGLVLVAVALAEQSWRLVAVACAAVLVTVGATMAVLFPGTGTMPFSPRSAVVPGVCCVAVAVFCRPRVLRVTALLTLLALPVLLLIPGAVGSNITRLVWIGAAPVVLAWGVLPRRQLVVVVALVAAWPVSDTIGQLDSANNPSAHAAYYAPLITELAAEQAAAPPSATGQRVEAIDPLNHWASVYLSRQSLARGWDRQADDADNPIFYDRGALTAQSYEDWLHQLAVGWVAVPSAPLDFASVAEAALVRHGLAYLQLVWTDSDWKLYRVTDASPLAIGAQVQSVTDNTVTITTPAAATVALRVRWSPYLAILDPLTRVSVPGCVLDDDGWVSLDIPRAETVAITSDFTVGPGLPSHDAGCVQNLAAAGVGPK
jgi:hypothetical protein